MNEKIDCAILNERDGIVGRMSINGQDKAFAVMPPEGYKTRTKAEWAALLYDMARQLMRAAFDD